MSKIRIFLTGNFGLKLISVVMALLLWSVVLGSRQIEVTKDYPLVIEAPPGLAVANDIPETVTFGISGPKAFVRTIADKKSEPVFIKVKRDSPGSVEQRVSANNIQLPLGVKVTSVRPSSFQIKLERVKTRTVPVNVELVGEPPEGFKVVDTTVEPATIEITGPRSRIRKVKEVLTLPIDVSDLREPWKEQVGLDVGHLGVQFEGTPPTVAIDIQPESANFRIKNVEIRVLTEHKSRVSHPSATVFVRADPEFLKNLDESKIFAEIDLRGKERGDFANIPLKIVAPKSIVVVQIVPKDVKVTLF